MLDIMDTAGQEGLEEGGTFMKNKSQNLNFKKKTEYSALRDQYMKTGQGFLLVYSITSGISFETASKLRVQILRIKEDNQDIPIVLVANKADLAEERVVSAEEGRDLAAKFKCGFIEVSAKTNSNVNNAFFELVRLINKWREKNPTKGGGKEGKKGCIIV